MSRHRCFILSLLIIAFLFCRLPVPAEASYDKPVLDRIGKSVFEVVVRKPTSDSLTYERPLPLELLPYQERTDPYQSRGTAFAISPTEYVTASHVLALNLESLYKDFFLRDTNGKVYALDKIVKYSDRRDFVVFTVKGRTDEDFLPLSATPVLNSKVYAIGNALGEGIVIRDGLYTSNTPEEVNGEWKWLRFSAAASPGNSGGPLMDEKGEVIGVILKKSPNENLNIALPIAEVVNAGMHKAFIYRKMKYILDNMKFTKIGTFEREIALPMPYHQFHEELLAFDRTLSSSLLEQLLSENRAQIFPNGKESLAVLNSSSDATFPHLVASGLDGVWDAVTARETKDFELGNNGLVSLGLVGSSIFMNIRKPDDVSLKEFYGNSKVFMDTLLKGLGLTRPVGIDKVRITSFGKAEKESVFTDSYQRKWLVRSWILEFADERMVVFALPVPGGCIAMMRNSSTAFTGGTMMDLKTLADFIYVSYNGSMKQWREFLAMKELLPEAFATMDISFDADRRFKYRSGRLSLALDDGTLNLSEKSELRLNFGYFRESGRTVWDVKDVVVREDENSSTFVEVSRQTRPPRELDDRYKSTWEKLAGRKLPFNRVPFAVDKSTAIATVLTGSPSAGSLGDAAVLYHIDFVREGTRQNSEMETSLDRVLGNLVILDDGLKGATKGVNLQSR